MKYVLKHANGDERIVDDVTVDTSTSLDIFGMDFVGYSPYYNSNIKNLLSHYYDDREPRKPLKGQIWYNSNSKMLNIYDDGWTEIKPPLPDMSMYAQKINSSMTGVLKISRYIIPSETSVVSRAYVDTKKFKFKDEKNGAISYVQNDNDYTILHMNLDIKTKEYIALPYQMKDDNYSISFSVNTVVENSLDTNVTFYDKSVNGFGIVVDHEETIGIIVMGYMTKNPISMPPIPKKILVFQIANENASADDDFEIILNDTSIGKAILSRNEKIGSLFIASLDDKITLSSGDFAVPIENMEKYYFDPKILIIGDNKIQMKNIKNANNGNYGILGIRWYLLNPDNTLSSPTVVDNLTYAPPSGGSVDFNFNYSD